MQIHKPTRVDIRVVYVAILEASLIASAVFIVRGFTSDGAPSYAKQGTTIRESGYDIVPPLSESTRRADLIVVADVSSSSAPFWNTKSGTRPQVNDRDLVLSPQARIFTPYLLDIRETLKGTPPQNGALVLNQLGGHIDKDQVVNDNSLFSLRTGQSVVALLRNCGPLSAASPGSAGFQYRLISRYIVAGQTATIGSETIPMSEVRNTISNNRSLEPESEMPC